MLGDLIAAATQRAAELARRGVPRAESRRHPRGFCAALRRSTVGVIAEIKRSSPSKGALDLALDAPARASEYEAGGAAALSVLTEPTRFSGSIADLAAVSSTAGIPVLRKDFIVNPVQVDEAAWAGADALLLIARALDPALMRDLAAHAGGLGLDVLAEVRDEVELDRALVVDRCAVGVNTRNLESLEIDPGVGERLLRLVPPDRVAVYESGIASAADVARAAAWGADAVLVGSVLSPAPDGAAAVRALCAVPRQPRG